MTTIAMTKRLSINGASLHAFFVVGLLLAAAAVCSAQATLMSIRFSPGPQMLLRLDRTAMYCSQNITVIRSGESPLLERSRNSRSLRVAEGQTESRQDLMAIFGSQSLMGIRS